MWGLWNARNDLGFNKCSWISIKQVLNLIVGYLGDWMKLLKEPLAGEMLNYDVLEIQSSTPQEIEISPGAGTRLTRCAES